MFQESSEPKHSSPEGQDSEQRFTGKPSYRVISLGAGVQSSVMALMAVRGLLKGEDGKHLPKPDYAIFSDTGWEPEPVYKHLRWLERELKKHKHGFKIIKVSAPKTDKANKEKEWRIQKHLLAGTNSTGQDFISLPVYILNKEGEKALGRRQCTREYKIEPIRRGMREQVMGLQFRERFPKGKWIEQWIGISEDEITRMKDARDDWCSNRWPLIEARMTREDCKAWFSKHYPKRVLPRSACIGCPMRTSKEWLDMKENDPESWKEAVKIDNALRRTSRRKKFGGAIYLHASMKPLNKVNLSSSATKKQEVSLQDECEGMCGV